MAWQANNDFTIPWMTMGAKALQAATTITSSAAETAVFVGRGLFLIELEVTAITLGSSFDVVNFLIQRNTDAAKTTWQEIGQVVVGDATGIGLAQGVDVYSFPVNNTGDYEIRVYAYMLGSAASVGYKANVYPVRSKEIA